MSIASAFPACYPPPAHGKLARDDESSSKLFDRLPMSTFAPSRILAESLLLKLSKSFPIIFIVPLLYVCKQSLLLLVICINFVCARFFQVSEVVSSALN